MVLKSLIISIFFQGQNTFLKLFNRFELEYSKEMFCNVMLLISGGLEIICEIILCNFRAVSIHCIFVRSNGGSINLLSHHLAYHITGNHRESEFNADNQNVSRKLEGIRRYCTLGRYCLI